jgi:predicted dinucleotide-binding enzyme
MKIGVVGTGNMGRHLGLLWAEQGHEVFFGSRTEEKGAAAAALSEHAVHSGTNAEAAEFGEVILFTVRGVEPEEIVGDTSVFDGKVVIDCNNGDVPEDFDYAPITLSLAEVLQQQLPKARVVKAFNTIPNEALELCPGQIEPLGVSIFIAGDDAAARETVAGLVTVLGMVPADCGALHAARRIETAAQLIIQIIIQSGSFFQTLSVVNLPEPDGERLGGREMSPQTEEDLAGGAAAA